jgi:ABC-type nitrate/sulfonate/bicarbonate transport system substrate-binding protein
MPRKRHSLLIAIVGNFLAAMAVSLFFANPGQATTVRFAFPGISLSMVVFYTAKENGFYHQEGLDVEFVSMSAGVANLALIGGNVEFAGLGAGPITAILRGAPLRFVFTTWVKPFHVLLVNKNSAVRTAKDLKGRKVAVSNLGVGPDSLLREYLSRNGLQSGRDVAILAIGVNADRLNSLLSGSVDAAILQVPFNLRAEEAGARELASFIKVDWANQLQGGIAVRDELARSNPTLVEKFVKATLKGFLYFRNNGAEVVPLMARLLKVNEKDAAKMYDMVRPAMSEEGTVGESLQKAALEQVLPIEGVKELPPLQKVFDYSVARKTRAQLEAEGWRSGP